MTYLTDKETYEADKMITKEEVEARTMNISQRIIELEKDVDINNFKIPSVKRLVSRAKLQLLKEIKEDVLKEISKIQNKSTIYDKDWNELKQNLIGEEQEK